MILSRIGSSLSRSRRSTFQTCVFPCGSHGLRSPVSSKALSSAAGDIWRNVGGGGIWSVRSFLSSVGAGKQFVFMTNLSDVNFVATNYRFQRLFSSETPKKNKNENYYPTNEKQVPKGEQKFESEGNSNSGDQGKSHPVNLVGIILCCVYTQVLFEWIDSRKPKQEMEASVEKGPKIHKAQTTIADVERLFDD